jgi:hypothetical protein
MSSGKSKRFAISRGTAGLVLGGLLALGCGLAAMAQSAAAGSHDGHEGAWGDGLEGTWRAWLTVRDCQTGAVQRTFPAVFVYAEGGTLTFTTGGQPPSLNTPGLGVWSHLHGHTYSAVSEAFIFSSAGAWTSTQRLTRLIDVGRDGKGYTDIVALEILDTNGHVIVTGCATSVASRMESVGEKIGESKSQ